MPRYFFDTNNGQEKNRDNVGIECESLEQVRDYALNSLPDMAQEEMPGRSYVVFTVSVRDEDGRFVFHSTLSLVAEFLVGRE